MHLLVETDDVGDRVVGAPGPAECTDQPFRALAGPGERLGGRAGRAGFAPVDERGPAEIEVDGTPPRPDMAMPPSKEF
jgi:hypothetical protein